MGGEGACMKLPLWAQVQVERFLDELKAGSVTIHTDGTAVRQVEVKLCHKPPVERPQGMTEY